MIQKFKVATLNHSINSAFASLIRIFFYWFQKKNFIFLTKRKALPPSEMLTESYSLAFHHILISDKVRINAYKNAIQRLAYRKNVLNIGTGPFACMAKLSVEANALHTTGVEANNKTYEIAVNMHKPIANRLSFKNCFSTDLSLPKEKEKYNLLIHEIIGCIGSDEGSMAILKDAKERLLSSDAKIIPESFITHITPVSPLRKLTQLESMLSYFFMDYKNNLDTKSDSTGIYEVYNFPVENFLSEPCIFEAFNYNSNFDLIQNNSGVFEINKKQGDKQILFDGFVLFLELQVDGDNTIYTHTQKTSWNVVYIKLLEIPIKIKPGEKIHFNCEVDARTVDAKYQLYATLPDGTILSYNWNGSNSKKIGII